MDCNVFGGIPACKALPANSSFRQQCPEAAPEVDCAFYQQAYDNAYDNPSDDMQKYVTEKMGAQAADACPQCFQKLQDMWCALAAPKCGTFRTCTRGLILPALTAVAQAYNKGDGELEALAGAVADSIDAIGAALPCREMCEDLLATCSCEGQQAETFGSLITYMADKAKQSGSQMPMDLQQRVLFKKVWDRPFCSLFLANGSVATSGGSTFPFQGTCSAQPASTCTARAAWCAKEGGPGASDELLRTLQGTLMLQMVRAVTGWISDDRTGLWRTKQALQHPDSQSDLDQLEKKYVTAHVQPGTSGSTSSSGMSGGQVALVVLLTLLGVALLAAGTVFGYRVYQRQHGESNYLELQQGAAFSKLADEPL